MLPVSSEKASSMQSYSSLEDGMLPSSRKTSDGHLRPPAFLRAPPSDRPRALSPKLKLGLKLAAVAGLLFAAGGPSWSTGQLGSGAKGGEVEIRRTCPVQPEGRIAPTSQWPANYSQSDLQHAADRLARAIQIPTESFEDFGPIGEDARWETRGVFLAFLRAEFPEVYKALDSEIVNHYGTVLTWKGRKAELQPVMLMAHQDVVPVNQETIGRWDYPPFKGYLTELSEDGWIYGRGSRDCKNNLIGIMTAVQRLLKEGYKPERTIILAFGFDEEIGGPEGAMEIQKVLLDRYGPESFAFIFDEGSQGVDTEFGLQIASLAMTEKGGATLKLEVETLGGHASVPPKHTGLGYLSILLAHIEANPVTPKFTPLHPLLRYYECAAEYAPDMPIGLKRLVAGDEDDWNVLAEKLADESDMLRSFLATSRAVDVVHGGSKSNALPENAYALIDSRLGFEDTVDDYHTDVTALLLPLIKSLNLTFNAFDERAFTPAGVSKGNVTLSGTGRNPPPITKSEGEVWSFMASLVRGVFGEETIVAPKAMLGGTDGAKMQILTKHLYRFMPARFSEALNAHATNEKITLRAHLTTIRFFYEMIGNLEGWRE